MGTPERLLLIAGIFAWVAFVNPAPLTRTRLRGEVHGAVNPGGETTPPEQPSSKVETSGQQRIKSLDQVAPSSRHPNEQPVDVQEQPSGENVAVGRRRILPKDASRILRRPQQRTRQQPSSNNPIVRTRVRQPRPTTEASAVTMSDARSAQVPADASSTTSSPTSGRRRKIGVRPSGDLPNLDPSGLQKSEGTSAEQLARAKILHFGEARG